ncbi:hypothetical protein GLAREA_09728 [Glarea lozoyensis ATCC 20868]|uniref:Uncharacterized protein n=1 Tax=Glarea lozoyensis (strain ATCC 20868 / MF5171) TaxID=1116229 RepID=S3CQ36_GLAL2|nr:uncharacterized protein GLAREA_09728 [Glarea lozoyensis ATCC 20868]EPE28607.1 hypothetical protein GLAREA_09728 [Glarea lozoyensis ATCC 20868]
MSSTNDPLAAAKQAEKDLNSPAMKTGAANKGSDSVNESGVDESVTKKFPGSTVTVGSAASGAGDNREIPESEGGDILKTGKPTKAKDFEGTGGPEDKAREDAYNKGGDDDVTSTVRQGGGGDGSVRVAGGR